jgi:acyl-ACP thioesterase
MAEPGATTILEMTEQGRVHRGSATVTIADVDPAGRCRLDAVMGFGQDIARRDWLDSGVDGSMAWLARRILVEVASWPELDETLQLSTWCSGYGGRWAERQTKFVGDAGARIDTVVLWVQIDVATGRPAKLSEAFFETWGESAAGRRVSARPQLPTEPAAGAERLPWPVRFADLDIIGHMNNAAQCAAVEEAWSRTQHEPGPVRVEVEFGGSLEHDSEAALAWLAVEGGVDAWLLGDDGTATAARVRPL